MRAVWPEQCLEEGAPNKNIPTPRRALREVPARHE